MDGSGITSTGVPALTASLSALNSVAVGIPVKTEYEKVRLVSTNSVSVMFPNYFELEPEPGVGLGGA